MGIVQNAYGSGSGMVIGAPMFDQDRAADRQNQLYGAGQQRDFEKAQLLQSQQPEMMKLNTQNAHWNALFPYLQNALGGMGQVSSRVGGHSGAGPRISGGPIFDQQKQQQQVNAMRAQGDQKTATDIQGMQKHLAGSGYGTNSPLAAALQSQMSMGNAANTADQVRQYRSDVAGQNAGHVLKAQQAQEGQYSNRMQEDIARRRNVMGYQTGLLGMLGQFM